MIDDSRLPTLLFTLILLLVGVEAAFVRTATKTSPPRRPSPMTVTVKMGGGPAVGGRAVTPLGSSSISRPRLKNVLWLEMTPRTSDQQQEDEDEDSSYNNNKNEEEALSVIFQRAVVLQRSGLSPQQALDEYDFFLKAAQQLQRRRSRSSSSTSDDNDHDGEEGGGILEPYMMAEVYGNQGALYLKLRNYELATFHLQQALSVRPTFGTAHVNLAICELQQLVGRMNVTSASPPPPPPPPPSMDQDEVHRRIQCAHDHCQKALECNTDPRSVAMAKKLLQDIENMKKTKTQTQT